MEEKRYIDEERVSLAGLITSVQSWVNSMLNLWKRIALGSLIIGGLYFGYQTIKKTNYSAETTFVLETDSAGGIGQLSSLANLAGVNLGALTENSSLFQIDNIIELYRSYTMMRETLLTNYQSDNKEERLITWYGREHKLDKSWVKLGIDFEINLNEMIVRHDSVLKEVVKDIREKNLLVNKPSRKLSILKVSYTSKNESFAKLFNETLVSHVNNFYLKAKTKKTGENVNVLSHQADSVKKVVDESLLALAEFDDENPNRNPLKSKSQVPRQKIMIDLQASSVVYQEMVKNLEIAKLAHRNSTPLIQIIDRPIYPLANDDVKWYKALVIGFIAGGILMIGFLSLSRIYRQVMEDTNR